MVLMNLIAGRNNDAEVENKLVNTVGEEEGGMN